MKYQDVGFFAAEPFINGVASLLAHLNGSHEGKTTHTGLDEARSDNVRIWDDDVREVFPYFQDGTFKKVFNKKLNEWVDSNLDERQWLHVRTKAFKRWFGDWENDPENASQIVDENGEQMVVYHGGTFATESFVPNGSMHFGTKEAAEQSHRLKIMEVKNVVTWKNFLSQSKDYDLCLYAYEASPKDDSLKQLLRNKTYKNILVLVGPEGGISDKEVEDLKKNNFLPISLGPRILRTQVAPLYVMSALSYEWEAKE
jgi:hypothetical protein